MVDHFNLLNKLRKYGLRQSAMKLIELYLDGNLQFTKVGQEVYMKFPLRIWDRLLMAPLPEAQPSQTL